MTKFFDTSLNGTASGFFVKGNYNVSAQGVFMRPTKFIELDINRFTKLKDNWDGYGGVPVSSAVADRVRKFVWSLDPSLTLKISDVFPNSHGTISIDWENEKQEKLSIEIGKTTFSYFVDYNDVKETKLFDGVGLPDIESFTYYILDLFKSEDIKYVLEF